jgi:hypothetical protein
MILKKYYVFICLIFAFSQKGFSSQLYLPRVCINKSDLPKNLEVEVVDNTFVFKSLDSELIAFYFKNNPSLEIPRSLQKNHLPILQFKTYITDALERNYKIENIRKSPFHYLYQKTENFFNDQNINDTFPAILNKKDLEEYLEIPFNYYYKGKFIKNKLRIFFEVRSPVKIKDFSFGTIDINSNEDKSNNLINSDTLKIYKVRSVDPLPLDFKIKLSSPENYIIPSLELVLDSIQFNYYSDKAMLFVKEFDQDVFARESFIAGRMPDLLLKNGKCNQYNFEYRTLASREKYKNLYDDVFNKYNEIFLKFKNTSSFWKNVNLNEMQKFLTDLKLYFYQPVFYTFTGNGTVDVKCILSPDLINFDEEPKSIYANDIQDIVKIPREIIRNFDVMTKSKTSRVRIIRKYVLNENWKPESSNQHDTDYLKKIKNISSKSLFKDSDLECLGEN